MGKKRGRQLLKQKETLSILLEEAADGAAELLSLYAKLQRVKDEETYLNLITDIDVSASLLRAKLDAVNQEIERVTDNLTDV